MSLAEAIARVPAPRPGSSRPCRQSSKVDNNETKKKKTGPRAEKCWEQGPRAPVRTGFNSKQQCNANAKDNMPMRLMPTAAQKKGVKARGETVSAEWRRNVVQARGCLNCGNADEQNKMRRKVCAGRRGAHTVQDAVDPIRLIRAFAPGMTWHRVACKVLW